MSGEILLLSNPGKRKRRKAKSKRKHASRRRSHAKRRRARVTGTVRFRSNPSPRNIVGSIVPTVKAGAVGALGGLANDLAYGFGKQYLPAVLQSGMGRHATKILSSIIVGMAGNYVLKGKGGALAAGAATVAIHEALKEQLAGMVPSLPLGALDEAPGLLGYDAGEPVGEYVDHEIGEYVDGSMGGMDEDL